MLAGLKKAATPLAGNLAAGIASGIAVAANKAQELAQVAEARVSAAAAPVAQEPPVICGIGTSPERLKAKLERTKARIATLPL